MYGWKLTVPAGEEVNDRKCKCYTPKVADSLGLSLVTVPQTAWAYGVQGAREDNVAEWVSE